MKTVKVTLTEGQLELFQAIADHVDAGFSIGDIILGLATEKLEEGSMVTEGGLAHLELAYWAARAKAGKIEIDPTWGFTKDDEEKDEVAAERKAAA